MEHVVNVEITETGVTAALKIGDTTYTKYITGNMDFTNEAFDDVFKQMGVELLCTALRPFEGFKLIIKYPDVNDPYDGFHEGEVRELAFQRKFTV
jgi:hypothetical protein